MGAFSLIGAVWAVYTIFSKSHPVRQSPAFAVPENRPDLAEAKQTKAPKEASKSDNADSEDEPEKRQPAPRILDKPRSPEVNAVLSQLTATRPATSPPPPDPAQLPKTQAELEKAGASAPALPAPTREQLVQRAINTSRPQNSNVELPVSIRPMETDAPEVKQVRKIFDRYSKANGWWERMSMVRDAGRIASLAHHYYDVLKLPDPAIDKMVGATRFDVGEESFVQLAFISNSRLSNTVRVNFVLPPQGEPQIDWESFVGYGEEEWKSFISNKIDRPTLMRGYVAVDDYYNYEFADRDRYFCVKLTSPEGDNTVFGYCDRHSPEGDALNKMTSQLTTMLLDGPLPILGSGPTVPVTIEIAFPEKPQTNKCVRVTRIISNRWVLTNAEQAEYAAAVAHKKERGTVVEK